MNNAYFVHQIQHNKTTGQWTKGIVIKDAANADNESAALQAYHAYLGAYAYGNNADIDYVYCAITAMNHSREPISEEWQAPIIE